MVLFKSLGVVLFYSHSIATMAVSS